MSDHGHVTPRADGMKARCGGPGMCAVCAVESRTLAEQRRLEDTLAEVERLRAERNEWEIEADHRAREWEIEHVRAERAEAEVERLGAEVTRLRRGAGSASRGSRRAESIGRDPCQSWPMPPDACW